ncbi:uncharacterized protein LOC130810784 [Amaranthus tricolor]|uniref:uncharacterized protein LOC130810784 n=1 Tax=Amaranthus tricolor TaxID=29722 RepID=UPI00258B20E3|nr:uncharacterized protein LOC130810784 [Amaranthus tricolor]
MHDLLTSANSNGKLQHGFINEIAKKYDLHRRTIGRIWRQIRDQKKHNLPINVNNMKSLTNGKARIAFDENKFKSIEKAKKTTLRSLSKAMEVSYSTVCRWKTKRYFRKHTNAIKPLLTDKNKLDRLIFCLSSCILDEQTKNFTFNEMKNVVHIDEKLFYITRTQQTFYLTQDEIEPHREIQSKRFIPKIMFMCAVARPIFSIEGEMIFDGKIGIFPFTHEVAAQRSSKNRKRGEPETKPIQSITKEHTRDMIVHKILPAIRLKWPSDLSETIFIQQDNAKPHILDDDEVFREVATLDGFNFHLVQQPPNSPDMNVLDLGFFRSIQSLQHQKSAYNYSQLVKAVKLSFDNLTPNALKNVWITLQACKIEVIKKLGGMDYAIPHMSKAKLEREGRLPHCLGVQQETIYQALRYLETKVDKTTLEGILFYLGITEATSQATTEAIPEATTEATIEATIEAIPEAIPEAPTEATIEATAYIPARIEATTEATPA